MTGLEKIIKQIDDDSTAAADAVIADAEKQAAVITDNAEKSAEAEYISLCEKGKKESDADIEKAKSGARLEHTKRLLHVKDLVIRDIANDALSRLKTLPDDKYFDALSRFAVSCCAPSEGELLLRKNDLDRLPKDFLKKINAQIKEKGAQLTICKEPADIDSGCILKYDGIEYNCTFDAVFEAASDDIRDRLSAVLFA